MSTRDARMRPRRDYLSRPEEKSHRGNNPPSRHLWVGNLSHSLTESDVAREFAQFGHLESVAFHPGRSYAFINFINEEDAFAAIRELQGYSLAGNPLKIEFAKPEKSVMPLRDEPYPISRESPLEYDSRARHSSPERSYAHKSRMIDKDTEEPSEVLWIGFPAQLKVDEFVLRKAFSPFGEIEKITTFPGRTYAFVRFTTAMSAFRAKETLQGKLFANPRVRICFARNDYGPSGRDRDRDSRNAPPSPHMVLPYGHSNMYENFHSERDYDRFPREHDTRSPPHIPDYDSRGLWRHGNAEHEFRRFPGQGSELGLQRNAYDPPVSPRNVPGRIREYSPDFYRREPIYGEPWDLPEDASILRETKKLKTNNLLPETELPEYPFADFDKEKHSFHPRDIPPPSVLDKNYDTRHSGYTPVPERLLNNSQPFRERGSHRNAASFDDFSPGSMPLPLPDKRRTTPDLHGPSAKEVWKWEGLIAKGGTPICRARCFPVGKPPDMPLPEYIDCTARTSLDMLAKHYYQASSACVVFFVPANDPDISYYNEFMNYLGEKQRAAVAKLDENTTLFLVPPSDFSEKVLKVPGKLSISGVVLRSDAPGGTSYGSSLYQNEVRDKSFTSFDLDAADQNPSSQPGPYLRTPPFAAYEKPPVNSLNDKFAGSSQSIDTLQASNVQNQIYSQDSNSHGENWHLHDPVARSVQLPSSSFNSAAHYYNPLPQQNQEATAASYTPGVPVVHGNSKLLSAEKPSFPAEQMTQLASLLGQQGHSNAALGAVEYKPSGNSLSIAQNNRTIPTESVPSNNQSHLGQGQQLQQALNAMSSQREFHSGSQMNQQFLPNSGQDDTDADPQKRLQATLQLAASLLQQIQHGKGN